MSTAVTGIQIKIEGKEAVSELSRLTSAFERLDSNLKKTKKNTESTTGAMSKLSDQGLANVQAGLVQLSTYLMNVNQGINNVFEKMENRFRKVENASSQLRISLGLPGMEVNSSSYNKLFSQYSEMEDTVNNLAASTQYTATEVYNALQSLVTAGFTPNEAIKSLEPALKLATASGGLMTLEDAIDSVRLSTTTLGGDVSRLEQNMDMLLKGTQTTAIGFRDMTSFLGGLGAVSKNFAEDQSGKLEASLFVMGAAMRDMGLEARGSGDMVRQFGDTLTGMAKVLDKNITRFREKGDIGKRAQLNRAYLMQMLGIDEISQKEVKKRLLEYGEEATGDVRLMRDRLAKYMLGTPERTLNLDTGKYEETGKIGLANSVDLMETFVKRYQSLVEQVGQQEADVIFTGGFGRSGGVKMLKGILAFQEKTGKTFRKSVEAIMDSEGKLTAAQKESLKTLEARIKLSESAEDALSNTIFKQDLMVAGAIDTYTSLVTGVNEIVKKNDSLAKGIAATGRVMQATTAIGKNFGFMLTAAATFSIALAHAQKASGVAMTGLGGTMKAFYTQFLGPTVRVVGLLSGGIVVLGVAFVGLTNYLSGASSVGEGLAGIFNSLKDKAQALTGIIRLAFSGLAGGKDAESVIKGYIEAVEGFDRLSLIGENDLTKEQFKQMTKYSEKIAVYQKKLGDSGSIAVQSLSKDTVVGLANLVSTFQRVFSSLRTTFSAMIIPVTYVMGSVFETLKFGFDALTFPIYAVVEMLNLFGYELEENSTVLKVVGYFIGGLISAFLVLKATSLGFGMVSSVFYGVRGAITNLSQSSDRLGRSYQELNRGGVKQISVSDQLRLKLRMLNATDEQREMHVNNLINKYRQLNVEQRKLAQSSDLLDKVQYRLNERAMADISGKDMMSTKNDKLIKSGEKLDKTLFGTKTRVAGLTGGMVIASMVMDQFAGFSPVLGVLSNVMMIIGTIIPFLSAGFFTMAASVLAATWPIILLIGSFLGLMYLLGAFKSKSDSIKANASNLSTPSFSGSSMANFSPESITEQSFNQDVSNTIKENPSVLTPSAIGGGPGTVVNNTNSTTNIQRVVVEAKIESKGDPKKLANELAGHFRKALSQEDDMRSN